MSTRRNGKTLFKTAGRGKFIPTVAGETTLKDELSVKKGRRKHPTGE